jgi:hypothetical protein
MNASCKLPVAGIKGHQFAACKRDNKRARMSDAIAVSGDSTFAVSSRSHSRRADPPQKLVSRQADPALCHADAMQIFPFCMADFYNIKMSPIFVELLARPKRFELLTPRFVV